jgi:hypothetical protein
VTFATSRSLLFSAALALSVMYSPALSAQERARLDVPTLPDAPRPQLDAVLTDDSDAQASSSQQTPPADQTQKPMTEEEKKKASENQLQLELHQRMAGVVRTSTRFWMGQRFR